MSDIVNAFFKRHYPADVETAWESEWCGGSVWRRYKGNSGNTIFPMMVCADCLKLSVQGHFGAYSYPRDDFADEYVQVEVLGPPGLFEPREYGDGMVGDKMLYGYVPTNIVVALIEQHGGLKADHDHASLADFVTYARDVLARHPEDVAARLAFETEGSRP